MAKPNPRDDPEPALNSSRGTDHRPATCPAPSPAALAILAGIVANSAVAVAGPTPPHFLCPSLALPPPASAALQAPSPAPSIRPRRTDQSSRNLRRDRALPYKFEQGEDGKWRHVDAWTLYGSTVCSETCRKPSNTVIADDVTSNPNSTDSQDVTDIRDTLPDGWYPPIEHNDNRTTLILSLSLVLAFFICFFIIGCVFWRKNVRTRFKDGDIEMKIRKRPRPVSTSSPSAADDERKSKIKQKIWAKATARWKDHARYTARLRRGKRSANGRSQPLDSTTLLNPTIHPEMLSDEVSSTSSLTPTQSRTVSRRPSSISLRESPPSSINSYHESSNRSSTPLSSVHNTHDVPSSPPAYRRGTLPTPIAIPAEGLSALDEHTSTLHLPSPHPSHLSFSISSAGPKSSIQPPESDSSHSHDLFAHVATDDKAILARLADLAEHPPETGSDDVESSRQAVVPEWEDEQLSDFGQMPDSSETDTSGSSSQCPFPPPPSKGKMAETSFYPYRYSFEEFSDSIDPELEPSAPPFEAPSAPGLGDMVMLPSAPPLTEEESPLEAYPSAPHFEAPDEDDDDTRDPITVDSQRSAEHQSAASLRPLSGGTLPGYHP